MISAVALAGGPAMDLCVTCASGLQPRPPFAARGHSGLLLLASDVL